MKLDQVAGILPSMVQDLIKIIGLPLALQLVEELGGTTFPVSRNKRRLGQVRYAALADVVGVPAADILTRHYGGDEIYIPRCAAALRELRNRQLRADFDRMCVLHSAQHVVTELVRKYRLSDRWVWEILKRADYCDAGTTSEQQKLF